ncbi:MAG TPA: DUF2950 domain-containing protein [Bryobacteraceae bacterium]|nr:DUF2950 domain-containing protein [Bryobacteraceae bacterium]
MRTALCFAAVFAAGLALVHAQSAGQTFATAQEAAQALIDATAKNDTAALLKIFGPAGKDIAESGDAAEDKAGRERFAGLAQSKMQVSTDPGNPNRATLIVGPDDWPFPVPLVHKNNHWYFDSAAGRVEVLARRVGRNEMTAIDVCRGYVEAQTEYAAHDRDADGILEYAQKIVSTPGKKDGLYWEGESDNLVPKGFADAAAALFAEGKKPSPYHGYYFHILKAQGPDAPGGAMDYVVKGKMIGGFALIAYPAEYGVSGIKTFLVSHHGVVYEKDLGSVTATLARQVTRFNPDKTWKAITGE